MSRKKVILENNFSPARLRALRSALGLTMEEFGERIGIKKGYVSLLEAGKRPNLSESKKILICEVFGVNRRWWETGEGEMFDVGKASLRQKGEKLLEGEKGEPATTKHQGILKMLQALERGDPQGYQAAVDQITLSYIAMKEK